MKNTTLFILALFLATATYAQKDRELKLNEEAQLVEATYYHDNGQVSQKGTFDRDGKLHGKWVAFDEQGNKISMGSYDRGIRTGTWFFWEDGALKEVTFEDNAVATVTDRGKTRGLAKVE